MLKQLHSDLQKVRSWGGLVGPPEGGRDGAAGPRCAGSPQTGLCVSWNSPPPSRPSQEKQDKVVLQAEVATLRQNNQRLQEESQHANQRLRKFAEIFSSTVDKEEL